MPVGRARLQRCPQCQTRMITFDMSVGSEGFEHRTFDCPECGHSDVKVTAPRGLLKTTPTLGIMPREP
jgi:Zn finger protein HypA/HybF involved in hydrogenase expression